jgi:lipopolysaccharide/colanic/teichoic acid biosynthesis glycosyltransferase
MGPAISKGNDSHPFSPHIQRTKRVVDLTLAPCLLFLFLPTIVACVLAVGLERRKGVVFRQVRVGFNGNRFVMLKFRSFKPMTPGGSEARWTIDPARIGPVGRFLRRTSIDEIPQLINVLRGEMSLVGPRPERPYFADLFAKQHPDYSRRLAFPCGITGWAQVNGLRGNTSIQDRVTYDNFYIDNWSLWMDLKILLLTIPQMLLCKGS